MSGKLTAAAVSRLAAGSGLTDSPSLSNVGFRSAKARAFAGARADTKAAARPSSARFSANSSRRAPMSRPSPPRMGCCIQTFCLKRLAASRRVLHGYVTMYTTRICVDFSRAGQRRKSEKPHPLSPVVSDRPGSGGRGPGVRRQGSGFRQPDTRKRHSAAS
jgi:hypothetical protein